MRQRVMIAMALACRPGLLLADEPTTALDVTVGARILDLLDRIRAEHGMSILLITHDLGIVARRADVVTVMQAGRAVEQGPAAEILSRPKHPYTKALLQCRPSLIERRSRLPTVAGLWLKAES
jgi:ABC-type dipeptide/oligopeptide/nickel transport system ATPase component